MILDFTLGNFGPFREDVSLSLEATNLSEHPENVVRPDDGRGGLLTSAVVFGPNAAGKSFLIDGPRAMREVTMSRGGDGALKRAYLPYGMSRETRVAPVRMCIRLMIDGILHVYRLEYDGGGVVNESLHHYPRRRRAAVFVRDGPASFPRSKKGTSDVTAPDETYLMTASLDGDPVCRRVRDAIAGIAFVASDPQDMVAGTCRMCDGDPEARALLLRALESADLGIDSISRDGPPGRGDVRLRHEFDDADEEGRTLDLGSESSGTRAIIGLMGALIPVVREGGVLVVDDLGCHLHPSLTRWIVRLFSSYNNGNGAQLIAGTHELGLMDIDGLLRRDQIWFVNRNRDNGASDLYCLSEFEGVRKDTDVLKAYLNGRFDAIPVVLHRGVL